MAKQHKRFPGFNNIIKKRLNHNIKKKTIFPSIMAGNNNKDNNEEVTFGELIEFYNSTSSDIWISFCEFVAWFGPPGRLLSNMFLKRITVNAPIILGFVLLCTGLHALSETYLPHLPRLLGVEDKFFHTEVLFSLNAPMALVNLFSHILVHADWNHLRGNMVHLMLVGPSVEHEFGHKNLFQIILVVALTSAITHIWVGRENTYQLGASGVVFACILLNSLVSASMGTIPMSFLIVSVWWIGDELYKFVLQTDQVSHHAHITGGIVGTVMGYMVHKKRAKKRANTIASKWYQSIKKGN